MDIRPILSALRRHRVTSALLVLEIALTFAIVCNAVFLIGLRLDRLHATSGAAENELVSLATAGIGASGDVRARSLADLAALRALPGVRAAAMVNQLPFDGGGRFISFDLREGQKEPSAVVSLYMGEGLIHALGLELVEGRDFLPGEYHWDSDEVAGVPGSEPTSVILTEGLARRLFPGEDPLGKTLRTSGTVRVVGVVRRLITSQRWSTSRLDDSAITPTRVSPGSNFGSVFVLRTDPARRDAVMKAAETTLRELDPHRIVTRKTTLEDQRAKFFAADLATTAWLVATCVALLVITALGIVGLASFWVAQRRRHIGVRRALGARRVDILRYFQTENFLLATFGIALGVVLAYGISLFLMWHDELPRLPVGYIAAGAVTLWVLGQLAVLSPALRAASVPPVVATRG
ncbi:ABC transporter permease [Luteibacter aegosomatis]|uniref:ABC transporter permease n=1 Tax=Luteibacter aegosomatis TaxID=2911537 RepID=UPI001FFB0BE6|nr:FtsX-like permease family protein [Luteibacter aegosomatis]UPG86965.1 ABC transporter permease [Luteibacter aegosomatis]